MNLAIEGDWHVLGTTFPMWKKGDKRNPFFRYTKIRDGLWKDEVFYSVSGGKMKCIKGKDRLIAQEPPSFVWRGSGWLFPITSKWQIDFIFPGAELMLISFQPTLFTPAGADIISRSKNMSDAERETALIKLDSVFHGRFNEDWIWL